MSGGEGMATEEEKGEGRTGPENSPLKDSLKGPEREKKMKKERDFRGFSDGPQNPFPAQKTGENSPKIPP